MENKKEDKIDEIIGFLQELGAILPSVFEDYMENFEKRAACERYFEKIIEAVVDLAFIILKEKKMKVPENEESSFTILSNAKIISSELAQKLKDAKGMRNIIAHEYGKIDDRLVYEVVTGQLEKDTREFIRSVKVFLK